MIIGIEDYPITPKGKGDCEDCNKSEFGCLDGQKGKVCEDYSKVSSKNLGKLLENDEPDFIAKTE